ncbi:major facilitator superfamily domain-containing protein [Melampsora americana]|nr:major facilitator superfamily domain-containing protein [Melampsora americana]
MASEIFPNPPSPTKLRRAETETTKVINLPKTISDLNLYYANSQGKLIIDPLEAEAEFGSELAANLKLDETRKIILWPQPSDSPDDPQNWTYRKKLVHLVILTMASFVPDFCSAIGIASLFSLAKEFDTTPGEINNLTSNWSIFLLGPGGILAVIFVKRYGRLPVLFWSQLIGLGFLIGCALAPTLPIFAAMRCLNAFFSTAPQVMGLYVVNDLYPFHLQARMLNFWTCGFLSSPFVAPWLFGYLVSKISYRWAYWIASMYVGIVVILIALFMEETIYDRFSEDERVRGRSFKARFQSLIGITGFRTADDRDTWRQAITPMIQLLARPHLMGILIYLGAVFGFGIGINVTNVVFVLSPPPFGFGLSTIAASSLYATPVIAVFIGEIMGRYMNDAIAKRLTHRNSGIFEPEMRLWTLYIGLPLYVGGLVLLGAAFQEKLSVAAIVFGWGLAEVATMVTTVACLNYTNNTFPFPGEISALLNQGRVLGGFAVPFFQVKWASSRGALETFGCEAAIITGIFLFVVPILQIKGPKLRAKFALQPSIVVRSKSNRDSEKRETEAFDEGTRSKPQSP